MTPYQNFVLPLIGVIPLETTAKHFKTKPVLNSSSKTDKYPKNPRQPKITPINVIPEPIMTARTTVVVVVFVVMAISQDLTIITNAFLFNINFFLSLFFQKIKIKYRLLSFFLFLLFPLKMK